MPIKKPKPSHFHFVFLFLPIETRLEIPAALRRPPAKQLAHIDEVHGRDEASNDRQKIDKKQDLTQYCSVNKNKLNKINVLNRNNTPSNTLSEQQS